MKVLDLFSGIGGFSLSAHWAGMTTAAFCEIDPFCQKVLNKNFPGVPIYDDVRMVTRQQLEKDGVIDDTRGFDIITGGPPCQSFSIAGKQRGQDDERHLWPEMFRIIQELQPSWIVVENVTGFIDLVLDDVLDDLESEGYATQSLVLPASAVGASHKRERIWIVAHSDSYRVQRSIKEEVQRQPALQGIKDSRGIEDWRERSTVFTPKLCRGFAIVPQVAYQILKAIMETE
jgi:DNA (cytosine-5)-methyltransferase 1